MSLTPGWSSPWRWLRRGSWAVPPRGRRSAAPQPRGGRTAPLGSALISPRRALTDESASFSSGSSEADFASRIVCSRAVKTPSRGRRRRSESLCSGPGCAEPSRAEPSRAARRPPPAPCHCSPSPLRCCPLPTVAARCSSALRCAALRGAFGPAAPTGPRLIGTAPGGGGWGIGAESISGSQMPPRHPRRWLKTISIVQFDCLNQTDLQQIHLSFDKSITVSFR